MIVRRCAQGYDIVLHKNNKPGMIKTIQMADGSKSTLTYPSAAKDYFVWANGEIIKRTDSFITAEESFTDECEKLHSDGNGRIDIVKHKIVDSKVVER